MVKDYYYLLGLPRDAPLADIKKAYRRLAAEYHPDKVASLSAEAQQEATGKMAELNEAIAVLSDSERRADYDQLVALIPERKPKAPRKVQPTPSPTPPPPSPPEPAGTDASRKEEVRASSVASPEPSVPPAASGQTSPQPFPPKTGPATPPPGMLAEEYVRKLHSALRKLPLNWKDLSVRGWQWMMEAGGWRRSLIVAHRHLETLSLLSFRSLQVTLENLMEQRKFSLRPTTVFVLVSYERLMDAKPVQEQLQALVAGERGALKNIRAVVVLYDGQRAALVGLPGDDAETQRVTRVLLGR